MEATVAGESPLLLHEFPERSILRPHRIPPSDSINDNFNCRIGVTKRLAQKTTYSWWYYNPHCSSLSLVAMLVLCSGFATGQAHNLFLCGFQVMNHFHIFILYKKIERVVLWWKNTCKIQTWVFRSEVSEDCSHACFFLYYLWLQNLQRLLCLCQLPSPMHALEMSVYVILWLHYTMHASSYLCQCV